MNIKVRIRHYLNVIIGKDVRYFVKVKCNKLRLGSEYGGWTICPDKITKSSIIYSFGIGEDISFDLEIIKRFNCKVDAFDPTPKSLNWLRKQNLPENFCYHNFAIANYDGESKFFMPKNPNHISCSLSQNANNNNQSINVPVKRLSTILLGLEHKKIDILKMDIEGAEYNVIEDILSSNIEIDQILIEFHHRFEKKGVLKTKKCIKELNEHGYKLFNVSESYEECSFIKVKE